jgi:hypothetical protein
MNPYTCDVCQRTFTRKQNLDYHVAKNVCVLAPDNVEISQTNTKCKFCGKTFTTPTNMYRHVNHTCKIKKKEDKKRDEIYERLVELEKTNEVLMKKSEVIDDIKKENEKLKKKVVTLEKNAKVTKNVINNTKVVNNNNINNGIVAHINLIGYGKEDLSKIDKKDIIRAIQQGFDSTIKLTETLHFNPNYPEYHNIYITNMKDKYAMMFDGKEWNLTMKDELINKIYDDKKNYIEENIDNFIESLSTSRKKALDRWLDTCDNDDRILKIKNEIRLLLYNKRGMIIDKHDDSVLSKKTKQTMRNKKSKKQTRKDSVLVEE